MREFLSWTHKHYHVHATTPVFRRKTDETCSSGRSRASSKDLRGHLVRTKPKNRGMIRKKRCSSLPDPDPCFSRHMKETCGADRRNYTASVSHESHIAHTTTLSASTIPDGGLTDHVPKNAMITERQFDLAKDKQQCINFLYIALTVQPR